MTPTSNPARILLLCDPGSTQEQITTALKNQPEFTLVDILDTAEHLAREVNRANPNIIILDNILSGQPTLDIMDEMAAQFPEVAIVAIITGAEPAEAQQVMLAGARAFVIQPFTQINLLSTLRRVHNLETRRAQVRGAASARPVEASHPLRVITVYSPRGGGHLHRCCQPGRCAPGGNRDAYSALRRQALFRRYGCHAQYPQPEHHFRPHSSFHEPG